MKLLESQEVVEALIEETEALVKQHASNQNDLRDLMALNIGLSASLVRILKRKVEQNAKSGS